jgi:L-fuconolactonase
MTIDIHPHVISTDTEHYPNAPVGGHKSDWSRERPVSMEQMIAAMDQAGIAKSVLVQASTCYGHDNSYMADAVAAYPNRFTGVFSIDVLAPDAPEKIRHWVGRRLTGMRLFTAGSTMPNQADWVDAPRSFPAWECASELGIPVCMQMTVKAIPQLIRMLERFPKVRVILDHLAKPTLSDGPPYTGASDVFRLADYKNLYLKLTPRTVAEAQTGKATHATFFPLLVSKFGASRIAWGSNYPASEGTLLGLLEVTRSALSVLSAEDRDWILARTALTLYPVLAGK